MRSIASNEAMIRIWGKEDCVIGKKIWDVLPEAQESFRNILDEVFNTGETYWGIEDLSDLMVNGKMHTLYFNFTSKALREADGRIYGILNMAIDVSEQVLTGRKMEASEELFRILAETLPQLVWVTDANGNQLYASGRWKQYTGIESLGEASWTGMVHTDDLVTVTKAWANSLATEASYRAEVRLRHKNGDYRWHFVQGEERTYHQMDRRFYRYP